MIFVFPEEFMGQFNAIAKSIRDVVIPEPVVDNESVSDAGEIVLLS